MFACAINCIDGRTQEAVRRFLVKKYHVKWVDQVTEPGPSRILAQNVDQTTIDRIKERVGVSVRHHLSRVVAIVAHPDCAGNPGTKEQQIEDLREAWETVKSFGFPVEIILLWVNGDWVTVEKHPHRAMSTSNS